MDQTEPRAVVLRHLAPLLLVVVLAAAVACSEDSQLGGNETVAEPTCASGFDSRRWKSLQAAGLQAEDEIDEQRDEALLQLADQVVRCRFLQGATRRRVERMLGERDRFSTRDAWWYYVASPTLIDDENLIVSFNRKGRVERVELGTD